MEGKSFFKFNIYSNLFNIEFFIQYYYTELQTVVTVIQFGILFRIRAVRIMLYKHCIIHHCDMALLDHI